MAEPATSGAYAAARQIHMIRGHAWFALQGLVDGVIAPLQQNLGYERLVPKMMDAKDFDKGGPLGIWDMFLKLESRRKLDAIPKWERLDLTERVRTPAVGLQVGAGLGDLAMLARGQNLHVEQVPSCECDLHSTIRRFADWAPCEVVVNRVVSI